jgi:serine/threonine-protein kinase
MTPERWSEIQRVYHDALERDAASRSAFVDQACAGDHELRREVVSLLAAHRSKDRLFDSGALSVAARDLANEIPVLRSGQRLG